MVWLSNGAGFSLAWNGYVGGWCSDDSCGAIKELRMDFNGDGKSDLVRVWKNVNDAYAMVWLSDGAGFSLAWNGYVGVWDVYDPPFMHYAIRELPMDVNGDGKTDLVRRWKNGNDACADIWVSDGAGFSQKWSGNVGAWSPSLELPMDVNGDGKTDLVHLYTNGGNVWAKMWLSAGVFPDLISSVTDTFGSYTEIEYNASSNYPNTLLPFILHPVSSISVDDGRGNISEIQYGYEGGLYDYLDREFRGFGKTSAYQMIDSQHCASWTETWFLQDYFGKRKIDIQIQTSAEGHTRRIDNLWENKPVYGGAYFPSLKETTLTITDQAAPSYSRRSTYIYDSYLNVKEEHKYGAGPEDEVHTYFDYFIYTSKWILSKPKDIKLTNSSGSIVSRRWMDYDTKGNMLTEEICKSDTPNTGCLNQDSVQNPVTSYQYYTQGNLWKTTDPRGYTTTLTYEPSMTYVYETTNSLGHKTNTWYHSGTGKLTQIVLPHLQGTSYSITYQYDPFGKKTLESRPDGGWTSYQYLNFGNPNYSQHVEKVEHTVGGVGPIDHYTLNYFDGLGRTYWLSSAGPDGKWIVRETWYDTLKRVSRRSNPYYYSIDTPYFTTFTYDGLSRVTDVEIPDTPSNRHITAAYQGLKKVVTNQRGYSTAYTYDVYQRLKKVEEPTTPTTTFTEYSYDTLGNLTQVRAAKDASGNDIYGTPITTTMTYNSLSKKRSVTDPDMGNWTYVYDKSGNLISQTDAKSQTVTFSYDGLNRAIQKVYPDRTVTFTYDDPAIPYSKGKLTKVSDPSGGETKEDSVLEYDLMQRVKKSKKKIGTEEVTFEKTHDSAGRVISLKYLAGTPNEKTYSYEYDIAGNLLYVKDNASGNHLVDYSGFTALGQQKIATFPKPSNVSVKTTYTYDPPTARLKTLITKKLVGGIPTDTYQDLNYQQFDPKGNITTLLDNLNGITHTYGYDSLDRLDWAKGNSGTVYDHDYNYDRIGNIILKSDVGTYSYGDYSVRPHAVQSAGPFTFTYDNNGNMTQRIGGGDTITINPENWNYDNKPTQIQRGATTITLTYDGNGQRVKKQSSVSGTTLYFGELYEVRGGAGTIHLFAGNRRVASVFSDGTTQFYHTNHLGSASVITDQNGVRKEKIEYFPFGTYRETVDYDSNFPDVFYTYTGQEDDDDLAFYNFKARLYDPVLGRFISPDSTVQDSGDPQSLNRYSYCLNNPVTYKDPTGRAFTPFHMVTEFTGALLGYLLGSGQNPFLAAWNNYALDVTGLNNLSEEVMSVHATAWERATVGEALRAAWSSFTGNLINGNIPTANHTFYDILSHWGLQWRGFNINDSSTWLGAAAHLVFNDIILGALFLPVALVESVVTNVWSAVNTWFSGEANVGSTVALDGTTTQAGLNLGGSATSSLTGGSNYTYQFGASPVNWDGTWENWEGVLFTNTDYSGYSSLWFDVISFGMNSSYYGEW
jgi:RHS repeat-associated protein